jgi:hypothetical protein
MSGVPSGPALKAANEISDTNTSTHILSFSTLYPKDIGRTYVLLPDKIAFLFPCLSFSSIPFRELRKQTLLSGEFLTVKPIHGTAHFGIGVGKRFQKKFI